ncbi:MAG: hydroxyacylglutathione hydrolase [Sphingomicrobium sp.]
MLDIVPVPAFSDNYIWLVHDEASGETAVVDPGDADPPLAEAQRRGWTITQVWNTHWHPDHTGGNVAVKEATGALVSAPDGPRIAARDQVIGEGSEVRLGDHRGRVIAVPGHTLDHVALIFDEERAAFVGDTLFAMGCGKLFEGTAAQMHRSLRLLAGLAQDVRLYPGHEYTLGNARFAAQAEPDNTAIRKRLEEVGRMREAGQITLPTTVAEEGATNPFVRAVDAATLGRLRADKDRFSS